MSETRKIVINACFGGFSLREEAEERLKVRLGVENDPEWWVWDVERDDPSLVDIVEQLGPYANGSCAKLKVVEIPADVAWHIHDYDGLEHVAENHRTWS